MMVYFWCAKEICQPRERIAMIQVASSSIRTVDYDENNLFVHFHNRATIYIHPGVPYWIYYALLQASSKGKFYNQQIRGRYR
jgi:KTSC domain